MMDVLHKKKHSTHDRNWTDTDYTHQYYFSAWLNTSIMLQGTVLLQKESIQKVVIKHVIAAWRTYDLRKIILQAK